MFVYKVDSNDSEVVITEENKGEDNFLGELFNLCYPGYIEYQKSSLFDKPLKSFIGDVVVFDIDEQKYYVEKNINVLKPFFSLNNTFIKIVGQVIKE